MIAVYFTMAFAYLCLMLSMAEISSCLPFSGGSYALARVTTGSLIGFLVGITDRVALLGNLAVIMMIVGIIVTRAIQLRQLYSQVIVWFVLMAVTFAALWQPSQTWRVWIPLISSAIIYLVLLATFIGCVAPTAEFSDGLAVKADHQENSIHFLAIFPRCALFFTGIQYMQMGTLDVSEPKKNVPRCLLSCTLLAFFLGLILLFLVASHGPTELYYSQRVSLPIIPALSSVLQASESSISLLLLPGFVGGFQGYLFAVQRVMNAMSQSNLVLQYRSHRIPLTQEQYILFRVMLVVVVVCVVGMAILGDQFVWIVTQWAMLGSMTSQLANLYSFVIFRVQFSSLDRAFRSSVGIVGAMFAASIFTLVLLGIVTSGSNGIISLVLFFITFCVIMMAYYWRLRHIQRFSAEEEAALFVAHVIRHNAEKKKNLKRRGTSRSFANSSFSLTNFGSQRSKNNLVKHNSSYKNSFVSSSGAHNQHSHHPRRSPASSAGDESGASSSGGSFNIPASIAAAAAAVGGVVPIREEENDLEEGGSLSISRAISTAAAKAAQGIEADADTSVTAGVTDDTESSVRQSNNNNINNTSADSASTKQVQRTASKWNALKKKPSLVTGNLGSVSVDGGFPSTSPGKSHPSAAQTLASRAIEQQKEDVIRAFKESTRLANPGGRRRRKPQQQQLNRALSTVLIANSWQRMTSSRKVAISNTASLYAVADESVLLSTVGAQQPNGSSSSSDGRQRRTTSTDRGIVVEGSGDAEEKDQLDGDEEEEEEHMIADMAPEVLITRYYTDDDFDYHAFLNDVFGVQPDSPTETITASASTTRANTSKSMANNIVDQQQRQQHPPKAATSAVGNSDNNSKTTSDNNHSSLADGSSGMPPTGNRSKPPRLFRIAIAEETLPDGQIQQRIVTPGSSGVVPQGHQDCSEGADEVESPTRHDLAVTIPLDRINFSAPQLQPQSQQSVPQQKEQRQAHRQLIYQQQEQQRALDEMLDEFLLIQTPKPITITNFEEHDNEETDQPSYSSNTILPFDANLTHLNSLQSDDSDPRYNQFTNHTHNNNNNARSGRNDNYVSNFSPEKVHPL